MPLKDVNDQAKNPLARTGMRTAWTQPEGGIPAYIHEARVIDFNLNNWTVDVRTQFDQKFFPNVQVASPYLHPNRGEGLYVMPEVNSKCLICIPSDGPPPFVLAFIMPVEKTDDIETEEVQGKSGMGNSTFAGGRPRAKPGDIYLKGRDGQFVVLHRGGVLQVGSTELAQRLYIPLGNIVTDISQNYEHHNTGGTISWGISSSSTDEQPETQHFQTFRLYANDEFSDVKVAIGKVSQPQSEPSGDGYEQSRNVQFDLGKEGPICVEFAITPQGYETATGAPKTNGAATNLVFQFDTVGNGFLRAEGSMNIRIKKKLHLKADDDLTITSDGVLTLSAPKSKLRFEAKEGIEIVSEGGAILLNGGGTAVAAVGSAVDVLVTLPIPITTSAGPGTIVPGPNARLTGIIANGSSTVQVPKPG